MAQWASLAAKVTATIGLVPNTKLLDALQENSKFLTNLSDQFSNFGKNIPTVCIYEGLPTATFGIVSLLAFGIVVIILICN
jgi:hypothetical protein